MTGQQLKNAILALAVQGKLVPQDPTDEPASELLERVKAEKARLVAEGKIKKEKPLQPITDEEKPFEIPEGWEWIRLGDIGALERGSGIKRNETTATGKPCIRYGELYTTYRTKFNATVSFTTSEIFERCCKVLKNDIVMSLTGENKQDIAMAVAYEGDKEIAMGGDMIRWFAHGMNPLYLVYLLNSPYGIACKQQRATGNIIVHISGSKLGEIPLPIPPLAEQKRIVEKIEELFPRVFAYDEAEQNLSRLDAEFPDKLKKSILQQAVQGKLAKQDKHDEPASELLKRIQAEKERLIAEGKIKKEKPLPPIKDEEKPFEIPKGWEWVRLGDITKQIGDIDHKMPPTVKENGIPYVSPLDFTITDINYDSAKQISVSDYERLAKKIFPEKDDIIFPRYGTIGVIRRVKTKRKFLASYSCCIIKPLHEYILLSYLEYVLKSPLIQREINRYINKTTQPNVGLNSIKNFLFPLPPLEEQKRIIEMGEEYVALCDKMKLM